MNRTEFLSQLENLLRNISPEERAEALQYYNDYFDDAGAENEQEVLEALGDPKKVAENIQKDLNASPKGTIAPDKSLTTYGQETGYNDSYGRETGYNDSYGQETGYNDSYGRETGYNDSYRQETGYNASYGQRVQYRDGYEQPWETNTPKKEGMETWKIVLITIICVILSPAIIGVAAGVFGCVIGLAAAWFALILAFGVTVMALFAVTVVLAMVAIGCFGASPMVGLAVIAAALICCGVGILFLMLTVAMAGIATPAICKGIARLTKKLFHKKEVAA